MSFSDEEIEAAVQALTEEGAFAEAESMVSRAAPSLHRILDQKQCWGYHLPRTYRSTQNKV